MAAQVLFSMFFPKETHTLMSLSMSNKHFDETVLLLVEYLPT